MSINTRKRDLLLLLIFIVIQAVLQVLVYQSGFPGLSGDDFFRALMAYEWSESPFLVSKSFQYCSIHWFPTHFWITGMIALITKNLVFSLKITSLFFHFVELFVLFQLVKHLFNRSTAYISVLFVGCLPWQVWASLSMTEMTMYFTCILGAFFFFMKWQKERRASDLLGAALLFLFSTMFRPEGWMFAALFFIYLLVFLIRYHQTPFSRVSVIISMILPSLFILFWLAYNFKEYGNPFYFLTTLKSVVQDHLDLLSVPSWVKGLQFPFLMFIVSPFLVVCILAGLVVDYRSLIKPQRSYLWFILAQLALLVLAALFGMGTTAAPQRYVLVNVILLTPFAAYGLSHLWKKKYGNLLVILVLFLYGGLGFVKSLSYPTQYKDIAKVGQYLREGFESGFMTPSDQISSELAFRRITDQYLATQQDFLIQTSAHAALAVYSGRPRNFLFNILQVKEKEMLKDNQSVRDGNDLKAISLHRSAITSKLREMQVTKLILRDRELMDWVPDDFYLEKVVNSYLVFSSNLSTPPLPSNEPGLNREVSSLHEDLGRGIILRGYKYEGRLIPESLSFFWELGEKYDPSSTYKMKMVFFPLENPEKRFVRIITPAFRWYRIDRPSKSALIEDHISLFLPAGMPNGEYSLKISFIGPDSHAIPIDRRERDLFEKELTLAPLTLISSKRGVFKDALGGGGLNWKLLAKVLVTL